MGNSQPILITQPGKPKREAKPGPPVGRLALVAGIFIIIVGWVDIFVGWFPLGFGSPEWEFGAVSATVDGLPLSTLGLVATLLGTSAPGSRWGLRVASVWAAWVLVVYMPLLWLDGITGVPWTQARKVEDNTPTEAW